MAKDTAVVSVGLKIDSSQIEGLLNKLKSGLSNAASGFDLSGEAAQEIKEIQEKVDELTTSLRSLGQSKVNTSTFSKLQKEIVDQVNNLEQRTSVLETSFRALINTMSSADGGQMAATLKDLMSVMDQTASAAKGMVNSIASVGRAVGKDRSISVIDTNGLPKELEKLKELRDKVKEVSEGDIDPIKIDYKTSEEAITHIQKMVSEYVESAKKLSKMKVDDPGFDVIAEKAVNLSKKISNTIEEIGNQGLDENISKGIWDATNSIDEYLDSIAKKIESRIDYIQNTIKRVSSQPNININKKGTGESGFDIPLDISTSSGELTKKITQIINAVQASISKEKIQINVELITPNQTKKANAALKKFQEQVDNISDTTTRTELQKIISDLQSGFGGEIKTNLKKAFNDAAQDTQKIVANLKKVLNSDEYKLEINPKVKFSDDDINKLKDQVNEITKSLSEELAKAVKEGVAPSEEGKKGDAFTSIEKRVKAVIDELNKIPQSFGDISLENIFTDSDGKLQLLIDDLRVLDGLNMGQDAANNLATNLTKARDVLRELVSLSNGKSDLSDMLNGWNESDKDMINAWGAKANSDQDHYIRERSAIYTKNGRVYGGYAFDQKRSTGILNKTLQRVKDSKEDPYIGFHSHPDLQIATMSYGNPGGSGDIKAFYSLLKDGIKKEVTATLGEVQLFDAEKFYNDFSNIDFSSKSVNTAIEKARNSIFKKLGAHGTTGLFLDDLLDEYTDLGFESVITDYLSGYFSKILDVSKIDFKSIVSKIKTDYKNYNKTGGINPINTAIGDVANSFGLDTGSLKGAVIGDILKQAGLSFTKDDLWNYEVKKLMPQVLEKALGKKYGFKAEDFFKGNYLQTMSFEEFQNQYGISKDVFSNMFSNTGIEDFVSQIQSLTSPLQLLSDTLKSLSQFSGDNKLNLGIDDASVVAQNIEKITNGLSELIHLYKQLNGLGDAEFDIDKLASSLQKYRDLSPDIKNKKSELKNLFGENSNDFKKILFSTIPTLDLTDSNFNIQWAQNIIESCQKAGIALDEFKTKEKEASEINIGGEQFDKLVSNSTTLKNSLNSLRSELSNLNLSTDLSSVTAPLEKLSTTLLELSEVVQKSTGILSKSNLDKEFEKIKESASKLEGVKFNTKVGKEGASSIISAYKDYVSKGGENALADIGGTKSLQKYLAKHINDEAKESAEGISQETSSLSEITGAAETAANAKEKFANANKELLQSAISSISGLSNEGVAFKNLTQMFNTLGSERSTEKLLRIREAIGQIVDLLNTNVGEASFIKSLENLASTGDALKDLATVLKATKNQINQAKGATGILSGTPEYDYAQEKLNTSSEELSKAGREYFSQFGLVLESVIRENRDNQLEFLAYVKTAENQIKEFTATSADGKKFNISNVSTNTPAGLKKLLNYERVRRAFERMNGPANVSHETDEIMFDRDADKDIWEAMKLVADQYSDYIGKLQKVTRQVRQGANGELLESFSFIGDNGHITMGREGDIVASSQNIDDLQGMVDAYEQLTKAAQNYYELKLKDASGNATSYEKQQLQEVEKIYNELENKVKIMQQQYGTDNIVGDALKQYQSTIGKQFDDYLVKQEESYKNKIEKITQTRSNQRNTYMPDFQKQLTDAEEAWTRINQLRSQHSNGEDWDTAELHEVNSLLQQIETTYAGLNDKRNIAAKTEDVDNLIAKLSKLRNDNTLDPDLGGRVEGLINYLQQVRTAGNDAGEAVAKINQIELGNINGQLKGLTAEAQRTGQVGKGFLKQFSSAITSQSAQFLATYFSLQDFVRYGKEISQTVIAIDSGMTELRKVSGETDSRLAESFKTSAATAKDLGATITDVIKSTADWSRLGYGIDQAEQLAKTTQLYQNVGDNMTQETASEYLVSTLQGFQMDASEAESIVDRINEVANNYAIDTAGIGEALKRSSAAFNASGTGIDKSIALVTAMTEVTQDPASAGTAWKTISARIRGASTELEELGEEQDEYTKSTSKLRDKIQKMTGFDIMKDENTFKDIYDIVVGIGEVWGDLTDTARADLLETLGGKRGANQLAAVMNNIDRVKEIYKTSLGSEGSAQKEEAAYERSIQYSIDQAKAQIQELSVNFLSSDLLKGLIDSANVFLGIVNNIVSSLDTVGTTIAGLSAMSIFKGTVLGDKEALVPQLFKDIIGLGERSKITKSLTSAFKKGNLAEELKGFDSLDTASAALKGITKIPDADKVTALSKAFGVTAEKAKEAANSVGDLGSGISIVDKASRGLDKIKSFFSSVLSLAAGNPLATIAVGVGAVALAVKKFNDEHQKALYEKASESVKVWEDQKTGVEEYIEKYQELKTQLDSGNLSEAETLNVKQQILDLQNQIVAEYGNQVSGIDLVNGSLREQVGILQEITTEQAKRNLTDNYEGYKNARKAMKEVSSDFMSLPYSDQNIEDQISALARNINGLNFIESGDRNNGMIAYKLDIDADDAREAADILYEFNEGLLKLYSPDMSDTGKQILDSVESYVSSYLKTYNDTIEKNGDINDVVLDNLFAVVRGQEAASRLRDSADNFTTALLSGEKDAIDKSAVEYYSALRDFNDKAFQAAGSEYNTFEDVDARSFDRMRNELTKGLNQQLLDQYYMTDILNNTGEDISKYNPYKDRAKDIKQYAKTVKDAGLDIVDIQSRLNLRSLYTPRNGFVDNLVDLPQMDEATDALYHLADALEVVIDTDDPGALTAFVNSLVETGVASGSASVDVADLGKTVGETTDEIKSAIEVLSQLPGILSEAFTGTGLSEDSLATFRSIFGDDADKAIERTANGIHLNREELVKLQKQYANATEADYLEGLNDQFKSLAKANTEILRKQALGEDTTALDNQRESILANISAIEDLISQYQGAQSAYNQWVQAQSGGSERDMYENAFGAYEGYGKQLELGWADKGLREWVHMMTGMKDTSLATYDEIFDAYEGMGKKLAGSNYSLMDFYRTDKEGNVTTDGIDNFFTAVSEKFGNDFVKKLDNGEWLYNLSSDKISQITDAWNIGDGLIDLILRAASARGGAVDFNDAVYRNAHDAGEARDYLRDHTSSSFKFSNFDLDAQSVEKLQGYLTTISDYLKSSEVTDEGKEAANTLSSYILGAIKDIVTKTPEEFGKLSEEVQKEIQNTATEEENRRKPGLTQEEKTAATIENAQSAVTDASTTVSDAADRVSDAADRVVGADKDNVKGETSTAEHEEKKGKGESNIWDPSSPFGQKEKKKKVPDTSTAEHEENKGRNGSPIWNPDDPKKLFKDLKDSVNESGEHPLSQIANTQEFQDLTDKWGKPAETADEAISKINTATTSYIEKNKEEKSGGELTHREPEENPINKTTPVISSSEPVPDVTKNFLPINGYYPDGTPALIDKSIADDLGNAVDKLLGVVTVEGTEGNPVDIKTDKVTVDSPSIETGEPGLVRKNAMESGTSPFASYGSSFQDWISQKPIDGEIKTLTSTTNDLGESQEDAADEAKDLSNAISLFGGSAERVGSALTQSSQRLEEMTPTTSTPASNLSPTTLTGHKSITPTSSDSSTWQPATDTEVHTLVKYDVDKTEVEAATAEAEQPVEQPVEQTVTTTINTELGTPVDTSSILPEDTSATIDVNANVEGTEDVDALNTAVDETEGKKVDVKANVAGEPQVRSLISAISSLSGKIVPVVANTGNSISQVRDLATQINSLPPSRTITITTIQQTINKGSTAKAGAVNGTAHAMGTAHAKGKWGLEEDENNALINEVGEEIVVILLATLHGDVYVKSYLIAGKSLESYKLQRNHEIWVSANV